MRFFCSIEEILYETVRTIDVPAIGWLCLLFALVEAAFALALRAGRSSTSRIGITSIQQPWLDGRLHGLMGTPTHLAPVLAIAGLFLLTRRPTAMSTAVAAVLFVCLVMTGSRSGLLGFCAASALFAVIRAPGMRISSRRLAQGFVVIAFLVVVLYSFADRAMDVIQMALRVDPPNWEQNRFVIWTAKLSEFAQHRAMAQMFGAGYRAEAATFNLNVEILMNHGFVYLAVFNALYLVMIACLTKQAVTARDVDVAFLVTVAVFIYVFSQGLNFIMHEFVTFVHVAMVVVFNGYFEYLSPPRGATRTDQAQRYTPRTSAALLPPQPLPTD